MKNWKRVLSLGLCAGMLCSIAGSGNIVMADDPVQISFMCWSESDNDIFRTMVEEFNAEYEGKIEIVPEYIASEDTKTKLPTLMAADTAPDIFMAWSEGYLQPYVEAGKVYSLQADLESDTEWSGKLSEAMLGAVTYNDEVYAIPTTTSLQGIFYNKEIYDRLGIEIPTTHEEYMESLKAIRDSEEDIIPMAFANADAWPSASHSEVLVNRIGGTAAFENAVNGNGSWTDEAFIKAGQIMQELANEELVPSGYNGMSAQEAIEQFKMGRAASLMWSSYCIFELEAEESAVKDTTVFTKYPAIEGGAGDVNAWLGQADKCLAISERCENKEAALEFIKYATSGKYAPMMIEKGMIPALKSEAMDMSSAGPILSQLLVEKDEMTELFTFFDVVLGSTVGVEYNNTVQSIMAGEDAEEAFADFQKFFDENYAG